MTARQAVKPVLTIGAYPEARYVRVPCNYLGRPFQAGIRLMKSCGVRRRAVRRSPLRMAANMARSLPGFIG